MAQTGRNLKSNDALNRIVYNTSALSGGIPVPEPTGAANLSSTQVTASGTAATLAVARPTRTSVLFRNLDSTNSVYIGPATVTSGNGMLLKAGDAISYTNVGLFQVIAPSGSPVVSVSDEYN